MPVSHYSFVMCSCMHRDSCPRVLLLDPGYVFFGILITFLSIFSSPLLSSFLFSSLLPSSLLFSLSSPVHSSSLFSSPLPSSPFLPPSLLCTPVLSVCGLEFCPHLSLSDARKEVKQAGFTDCHCFSAQHDRVSLPIFL